jgi:eukaryotic-like serine/threonine-protein kinase
MGSSTEEKLWVMCPVCHKANPAGSEFCQFCWGAVIHPGKPLTTEEMQHILKHFEDSRKRMKTLKIGAIIGGVLGVLLVIFFSFYYLTDKIVQPPRTINSNSMPGDWSMFQHDLSHSGTAGTSDAVPQGTLKWVFKTDGAVITSPAVSDGTVYIGSEDSKLYALNAETGDKIWDYLATSWIESSAAVSKGTVYFGSNDGFLYAVKAADGKFLWDFKTIYPIRSAPAVAGNTVFFGADDYNLYAINANTGRRIWSADTKAPVTSSPVVANGIVYAGSADGMTYAFNTATGQRRLRFDTFFGVFGSPVIDGTTVHVITSNGRVYVFDGMARTWLQEHEIKPLWVQIRLMLPWLVPPPPAQSGYLWSIDTRAPCFSSPSLAGNVLYTGLESKVTAIDLTTHKILWSFKTGGIVRSTPAIVNNTVFAGSDDGKLYALDAGTGKKLWEYATGGPIISSPAVVDGVVYFGSSDGSIYALK